MTDPIRDEEVAARVREHIADGEALEFRLLMFHSHVRDIGGQVGILLRAIADAHTAFVEMVELGGTTAAEETRLHVVLEEAMTLTESMLDGGVS